MNYKVKYLILGAFFGLLFPLIATLMEASRIVGELSPAAWIKAQSEQPLLWIIDTAPLFLGFFAYLAGVREDRNVRLNSELKNSLADSRSLNEGLFGQFAFASILIDDKGIILTFNQAAERLSGFKAAELTGKGSISNLLVRDEFVERAAQTDLAIPSGVDVIPFVLTAGVSDLYHQEIACTMVRREGTGLPVRLSVTRVNHVPGVSSGFLIVAQNMSRQKATEDALHDSERTLRKILELLPVGVFVLDGQGNPFFANARSAEILGKGIEGGLPADQLSDFYEVFISGTNMKYPTAALPVVRALQGETSQVEDLVIRHGDSDRELEVFGTPVTDDKGSIRFAVAVFHEITQRKNTQRSLAESEETFRTIFDSANVGIFLASPTGIIHRVNSAFCRMVGLAGERLRGKSLNSLVEGEDRDEMNDAITRLSEGFQGTLHFVSRFLTHQGKVVWGDVYVTAIRNDRGNLTNVVALVEDITFKREAERKQQEFLDNLRKANQVLDTYSDNLRRLHEVLTSPFESNEAQMRAIVTTGARVFGASVGFHARLLDDEMVRLEFMTDDRPGLSTGTLKPLKGSLAEIVVGRQATVYFHNLNADQAPAHISESPSLTGVESFIGAPVRVNQRLVGVLGYYSLQPRTEKYQPQDAEFIELLSSALGRTFELEESRLAVERSHLALEKTNEELRKSNEGLDQFAYVVSHDLKAPLRGINSLSEWIEEDLGPAATPTVKEKLALLKNRVQRMSNLINGILDYSRIGRSKMEVAPTDVKRLVDEVIDFLGQREGVTLVVSPSLPVLPADRTQLSRVFINLIGNAIKYMDKPGGKVEVFALPPEHGMHTLCVRDNGPGIDPRYHEKVFGIFQRLETREEIEGTGIGLSIVKKIIEECGGKIWIESEPGRGAAFWFTLPE